MSLIVHCLRGSRQRAGRGVEEGEGVDDEQVVHPRATEAGVEGAEGADGGTAA